MNGLFDTNASSDGMPNPFAELGMMGDSGSSSSSYMSQSRNNNIQTHRNVAPAVKGGINLDDESQVIQIMNKLRNVGAQMEIDLPTIALCGQQSCGKSSLTEAISGVAMPRASGTCTRCPTELRLIQTPPNSKWECKVGIRFEFDDQRQKPLSNVEEISIGKCTNPSQVTDLVTRAQTKILQKQNTRLKFSRNVITVEVYAADIINLTVIDMPGLIFAIEKEEDTLYIELVSNLVRDTLRKPNTLIAAVISCKDDMENQIINQLARTYDPKGIRTIGILTKVDTIEKGLEGPWINVLENKKYPLRLGYVAVRNPSQSELNKKPTYAQARNLETSFFKQTPWSQLDIDTQERLGAKNLVRLLSETLGSLIVRQLPKMSRQIEHKLSKVQKKLLQLPPAPKQNASALETVFDLLVEFTDQIKTSIRNEEHELWQESMTELHKLYDNLESFKPRFSKNNTSTYLKSTFNSVKNRVEGSSKSKFLYTMEEVVEVKKKYRKRNMTCSRTYFVKNSMEKWEDSSRQAILATSRVLAKHIQTKINHIFQQFIVLSRMITDIIQELINDLTNSVMEQAMTLLNREIESEFTLSTGRLHATYQQALEQLSTAFGIDRKDETKYNENEAIMIMANAVAYYDLAFRRYVDVLAMTIEDVLFRGVCKKLDSAIRQKMNLFKQDNASAKKWLSENQVVAKKREELTNQLNRLQSVAKELRLIIPVETATIDATFDQMFSNDSDANDSESKMQHLDVGSMNSPSISSTRENSAHSPESKVNQSDSKKKKKSKKKGWFGK